MSDLIESMLGNLRQQIAPIERQSSGIDVVCELQRLLHSDDWNVDDIEFLDRVSRRIDIGNRVFTHYDTNWKINTDREVVGPWLCVIAVLLFKKLYLERNSGAGKAVQAKTLNALLKVADLADFGEVSNSTEFTNMLHRELSEVCALPPSTGSTVLEARRGRVTASSGQSVREIDLTVLFYEGPIARAYLETIKSLGMRPKRIINLVTSKDLATGKPTGRWLPRAMRVPYAANVQRSRIHYWPRTIRRSNPELFEKIGTDVEGVLGFDSRVLAAAMNLAALSDYSDQVDDILVANLRDPALDACLSLEADTAILFTGGGIVPETLLAKRHLRFIHVHPGFLPDIRGADCVLWSALTAGTTSASSFYMSPGIDTGDIVMAKWLPRIEFALDPGKYDLKTLYRSIYAWFDPWVRAYTLRATLEAHDSYFSMPSVGQNETSGTEFHFMHDRMREIALNSLFQQGNAPAT